MPQIALVIPDLSTERYQQFLPMELTEDERRELDLTQMQQAMADNLDRLNKATEELIAANTLAATYQADVDNLKACIKALKRTISGLQTLSRPVK